MSDPDPNTLGHFFENFTTAMLSVIITLVGFWTAFIRNLMPRKEIEELVKRSGESSQYAKDRQFIFERLNTNKEMQDTFASALVKNGEIMNELRIQMATLTKTLENIENRFEQ
tara:strand:- start:323 stop:661 length:339 start_codon:yes stop_codon:yes gene_type:complete